MRLAGAAALAVVLVLAVVLLTRHSGPADVRPIPHAATPAGEARNLEAWLRRYSG